jgi:hypothetical protein
MLRDFGPCPQRLPQCAEGVVLGYVADLLNAGDCLDLTQQIVELRRGRFVLQVDNHTDALAPLADGAFEIE